MKISRCVIFIKEPSGDYIAVCTLTEAIIRLNPEAKKDLEKGDQNNLSSLTRENFDECIKMGFLVPDHLDEKNYLSYILNKDRFCPMDLTTYVAFSTVCNFKCVYCYEAGQVKYQTMTKQTIELLVDWYKYKLKQNHYKACFVYLYGGEPLLFTHLIISLLSKLKRITKTLGVKLKIGLVSNGYLLTSKVVRRLLSYGLTEIHVTIDGSRKIHNQRRLLAKGGKGTFDVVFNNLIEVASVSQFSDIDIVCRISFDETNVKQIPDLLDEIKQKDKSNRIYLYFGSITQTASQISIPESFCSQHVLTDKAIAENMLFLYREAKQRGFSIPDFFTLGPCMTVADNAGVIAPDGLIYKCLDMMGQEKLAIGNVSSKEFEPIYYDFMRGHQLEECLDTDCPFVPVCGGGCAMGAYLKTGDHKKTICRRQMLELIYSKLLPLKFSNENQ